MEWVMAREERGKGRRDEEAKRGDKAFDIRLMLEAADQFRACRGPFSHIRRQW